MSTKVLSALLLNNKIPRTKIPTINPQIDNKVHQKLEAHDKIMKDKLKKYFNNRYHKKLSTRINKLTPPFDPHPCFLNALREAR